MSYKVIYNIFIENNNSHKFIVWFIPCRNVEIFQEFVIDGKTNTCGITYQVCINT